MYPVLIDWGPIFLPAWHFMFVIGALAAYGLLLYLRSYFYTDISAKDLATVYLWSYVGGYFGARSFSIIAEQSDLEGLQRVIALFQIGPMTFYGGMIGAIVFGGACAAYYRISVAKTADLAIPAGMLGLAYGRIGCFLNGDDFGKPVPSDFADAWWAVTFPNLGDFVPRYPVQLVEAMVAGLIVVAAALTFRHIVRWLGPGAVALQTLLLYASYRLIAEEFRGDDRGMLFSDSLSPSQYVSIAIMAIVALLLIWRIGRALNKKPSPESTQGKAL